VVAVLSRLWSHNHPWRLRQEVISFTLLELGAQVRLTLGDEAALLLLHLLEEVGVAILKLFCERVERLCFVLLHTALAHSLQTVERLVEEVPIHGTVDQTLDHLLHLVECSTDQVLLSVSNHAFEISDWVDRADFFLAAVWFLFLVKFQALSSLLSLKGLHFLLFLLDDIFPVNSLFLLLSFNEF